MLTAVTGIGREWTQVTGSGTGIDFGNGTEFEITLLRCLCHIYSIINAWFDGEVVASLSRQFDCETIAVPWQRFYSSTGISCVFLQ